ncbi:MAG: RNA polymerase sigma factor RpoD/SigA [Treponemataceae bacterium]|nr:MAG: RNA polymerase sigma factor RpoD/SigA [Treponemataceae bacterium]
MRRITQKRQSEAPMASNDSLSLYLKDINKIPLLTRDEETNLAIAAAQGDAAAKNKIVKANLRFVVNVAKKYQNHGIDLGDLISEGNIGLLTAIERFDVNKGYHFISYAVWWIRQAILKAICEKSRMIRLPLNRANEYVRIERARKTIFGSRTDEEEISEIARTLGMTNEHVRDMLAITRDMVSLDSAAHPADSESATIGEFIEDDHYETPENSVIHTFMREDIDSVLSTLTPKEAGVIKLRYGLNGHRAMSLKEVGDEFNLTKERIRQIERRALHRLQHPYRIAKLQAYVA